MQLQLVRHLWGMGGAHEQLFPRIKAQGYGAIETGLPETGQESRFQALLREHGLGYIPQIFTSGDSVGEHLDSFSPCSQH